MLAKRGFFSPPPQNQSSEYKRHLRTQSWESSFCSMSSFQSLISFKLRVHHASCILINMRVCDHDCALRKYVSLYLYRTPWRSTERELRSKLTSSSVCVYYKDGHWWSWDCIKIVNISTIKWSLHFVPLVKPPRFLQYRDSDWSLSLWLIPATSHKAGPLANILNDVYQVSIFECCF